MTLIDVWTERFRKYWYSCKFYVYREQKDFRAWNLNITLLKYMWLLINHVIFRKDNFSIYENYLGESKKSSCLGHCQLSFQTCINFFLPQNLWIKALLMIFFPIDFLTRFLLLNLNLWKRKLNLRRLNFVLKNLKIY